MPERPYTVTMDDVMVEGADGTFSTSAIAMDQMFVQWTFGEQGHDDRDAIEVDEIDYVLDGVANFTLDGELYEATAGQVLYIPAGVERVESGGPAKVLKIVGGLPWDRIDMAEHQFMNEYRNWPAINK